MRKLSKVFDYSGLVIFSLIIAVFLLALTTNVSLYQSADEVQTVGLKTWSGFPVPYKVSAPGMQSVEFKWWRMLASMLIWVTTVFTVLKIFIKYHFSKHPEAEMSSKLG